MPADTVTGSAPGTQGGQAPASAPPQSQPSQETPSGTEQADGGDPFSFAGAPTSEPGQGKSTETAQPSGDQGKPPQEKEPPKPPTVPEPGVKDYLATEFGGDPAKLNKAYANMVPKFTQVSQNLSTALQVLKKLDEVAGPEIKALLVSKGVIQPGPDETKPPPASGQTDPATGKPLTREDVVRIMGETQQRQQEFNNMISQFKQENPDWESFKAEIGSILEKRPYIADLICEGQMDMGELLALAKGLALPKITEDIKKKAHEEGLRGKKARDNAHMEDPSSGVAGGEDFDPFNFKE